jgi:hypothetical protein
MSPEKQIETFMDKYSPEISTRGRAVLAKMRVRLPGSFELVYDNYNALVVGFGPSGRASDAIFSIIFYPRWISICFLHGASLPDPQELLQGTGHIVRHIVLESADTLDAPGVADLMARAISRSEPIDPERPSQIVIKSISAKQRPSRPLS